ncbi:MAG: TRAP transporter fused permease subunit [Syntrophaceae bacterium]|nr:TRAP transporter fused permease subunit [Syntrophaceae bacterium]
MANKKIPPQEEKTLVYRVDEEKVKELVETFDPELRFRNLKGMAAKVALIMCLILSLFHIETAGFGVLQEWKHRCFHLSFVLSLIFLVYPTRKVKVKNLSLTWVYEVLFALVGGLILSLGFQSVLKLSASVSVLVFVLGFFLSFAMKTRDLWAPRTTVFLDMISSLIGLGALFLTALILGQNWKAYVEESAMDFILWTLAIFIALTIPLLFMLWDAVRNLQGKRTLKFDPNKIPYFEMTLAALAFALSSYIIFDFDQFVHRAGYPNVRDLIIGNFALLLVLEGTRRSIGVPLAILGLLSLLYCYLGPSLANIPGISFIAHRGFSPSRIIDQMYLGTEGIYGVPLGVVATFVFHFVLFGIFTMKTGLGKLFIDLATALAGWSAGGPAKVAIVSSGLLGCISGSSVANTVTTGAFTIPMMKKMGYNKEFAGAVEASASTGGQFMPPIMGAAAFIMAEFLGISYLTIATCAIIPAICHFFAVGVMVHFEAKKNNMRGIPRDQLPNVPKLIRENGTLVIPLVIIIWLLVSGFTPFLAAFWGILSSVAFAQTGPRTKSFFVTVGLSAPVILFQWNPFAGPVLLSLLWFAVAFGGLLWTMRRMVFFYWVWGVIAMGVLFYLLWKGTEPNLAAFWCNFFVIIVGLFLREGRMRLEHVLDCLEWGTKNALAIGAACAAVGLIVGTMTLTGLGLKVASATIQLASATAATIDQLDFLNLFNLDHTTMFFLLAYTAIASLILGMGLPTTPNYIVVSIIAAPALLKFGVAPLLSHMFVFYFGILADLTPPVAVAAYAASGISQGDPFKTGLRAFTLAWTGMYIPFAFVFSPILVWMPWILEKQRGPFPFMDFFFTLGTVALGIITLGAILIGYFGQARLKAVPRMVLGLALLGLWWHEPLSSYIGAAILLGVYLYQRFLVYLREARSAQQVFSRADPKD